MSEILETYQEEQEILTREEKEYAIATIIEDKTSTVIVKFDGEEENSTKEFPKNVGIKFSAGQRVVMRKINGNYICEYPISGESPSPSQKYSIQSETTSRSFSVSSVASGNTSSTNASITRPSGNGWHLTGVSAYSSTSGSAVCCNSSGQSSVTVYVTNCSASTKSFSGTVIFHWIRLLES